MMSASNCKALVVLLVVSLLLLSALIISPFVNHDKTKIKTNAQIMLRDQRQYVSSWEPPSEEEIMARNIPVCLNITHHNHTLSSSVMPATHPNNHVCLRRKWNRSDEMEGPVYFYQPNWGYGGEESIMATIDFGALHSSQTVLAYDTRIDPKKGVKATWRMRYEAYSDKTVFLPSRSVKFLADVSTEEGNGNSDYDRIANLLSEDGVQWNEPTLTIRDCDLAYYEHSRTKNLIPDICYVDAVVVCTHWTANIECYSMPGARASAVIWLVMFILATVAVSIVVARRNRRRKSFISNNDEEEEAEEDGILLLSLSSRDEDGRANQSWYWS